MKNYIKKNKMLIFILILITIVILTSVYHSYKPLPQGVSFEGEVHNVSEVDFLYDITYGEKDNLQKEHAIFDRIYEVIDEAEEFIVIDMFLFNGYHDGEMDYPPLSSNLKESLISKKKENPDLDIVFITDEINTTYGSHEAEELSTLEDNGIRVIETNVKVLRDSNPLYSGVWRVFFQWFGQGGSGWIKNPMAKDAPETTVRSYLKLLNIKANHRKVIATDKTAIISSANPHDASGLHSNTAFEVSGNIIGDILKTEQAILDFSGGGTLPKYTGQAEEGDIAVQLLTERKILDHVLEEIKKSKDKEEIWVGMFYLAERKIIEELIAAADRGVTVNLILDPNEHAFGQQKIGLPNRPVAAEMVEEGQGNIELRWYNTQGEQYHPKMIYFKRAEESTIIGGSANFTRRNLYDLNLETDIKITANNDEQVMKDMDDYFLRLWSNEDEMYTLPYETYKDEMPIVKKAMYRLQKIFRFTTY
ncbi:phospholipase D family protein [Sutcliffiella horikoshii]|uniref:phospholipase D family protein n=1 Tax=Sutcliffiella horikoshii TaxID=79883 RepID=UPI001CBE9215|nr:phospholipase D family protein [Sutcliffiella horikoshii]UAL45509.1 phospholipase D family protein [Sutcliffiella horikoshii]